jgi:hypothetical protein
MIIHHALRRQCRKAFLVGAVLGVLWSSPAACAAEREGPVLFFSMEDLQLVLSHSSPLAFPAFWSPGPSVAGQEQSQAAEHEGPVERSCCWGNELRLDGYTRPGTRPLWGY